MRLKSPPPALGYFISGGIAVQSVYAIEIGDYGMAWILLFTAFCLAYSSFDYGRTAKRSAERELADAKLFPCTLTFERKGGADVPNVPPMGTEDGSTLPKP
jgi:hypothetical protein